jgi:hypothetical protein
MRLDVVNAWPGFPKRQVMQRVQRARAPNRQAGLEKRMALATSTRAKGQETNDPPEGRGGGGY